MQAVRHRGAVGAEVLEDLRMPLVGHSLELRESDVSGERVAFCPAASRGVEEAYESPPYGATGKSVDAGGGSIGVPSSFQYTGLPSSGK